MRERDLVRVMQASSYRTARETRAFGRGVVTEALEDGRGVVQLPGGQRILVDTSDPDHYSPSEGQSVRLLNSGGREMDGASAYGGGNGSPFSTP